MTPEEVLRRLEMDPRFKKLSYQEQVEIRARIMAKALSKDERFQKYNPVVQQRFLAKVAFRPPSYENAEFEAWVRNQGAALIGGDKDARKMAANYVSNYIFNEGWGLQQWLNKNLYMPFLDALGKAAGPDVKPKVAGGPSNYEYWYGADRRKAVAYFQHLLGKDSDVTGAQRMKMSIAPLAGEVADLATWWAATGFMTLGVGALGQAAALGGAQTAQQAALKAATKGASKVSGLWKWLNNSRNAVGTLRFAQTSIGQSMIGDFPVQLGQAVMEGAGDVLRDAIKVSMAKGRGFEVAERKISDVLKIFGLGAARDFAWGMAMSTLMPLTRSLPKVFSKRGFGDYLEQISKLSDPEAKELFQLTWMHHDIPDRLLKRQPEWVQERILALRRINEVFPDQMEKILPGSYAEAQVNAHFAGASLVKVNDNLYRLRPYTDHTFFKGTKKKVVYGPAKPAEFKTMSEVNDFLASWYSTFPLKADRLTPLNFHLFNRANMNDWLEYVMDPTAALRKGAAEAGTEAEALKKAVRALRKEIKSRKFTPPSNRQYITPVEAEAAAERAVARGGKVYRVSPPAEDLPRMASGEILETQGKVWNLGAEGNGEVYLFTQKTAPFEEYEAALKYVAEKNVQGLTVEEYLLRSGYDSAFTNAEGTGIMTLRRGGVKFMSDKVNPATGTWGIPETFAEEAIKRRPDRLFMKQIIQAKIPLAEMGRDDELMARILMRGVEKGAVDGAAIHDFAAATLASHGLSPGDYKAIEVVYSKSLAAAKVQVLSDQTVQLILPRHIISAQSEKVFVRSLVDQLNAAVKTLNMDIEVPHGILDVAGERLMAKDLGLKMRPTMQQFASKYAEIAKKGRVWTSLLGTQEAAKRYLKAIGQDANLLDDVVVNPQGKVDLLDAKGRSIGSFENLDEAYDQILKHSLSQSDVRHIVEAEGLILKKTDAGGFEIRKYKGGDLIAAGKTPGEALAASGIDYKVPPRYMPKRVKIDEGIAEIEFDGVEGTFKSANEAFRFMSKFDVDPVSNKYLFTRGSLQVYRSGTMYNVADFDLGHFKRFKSFAEAKEYYAQATKTPDTVRDIGLDKGIDARMVGGKYNVTIDGKSYTGLTEEQYRALMKAHPMPGHAPELVDVSKELGGEPENLLRETGTSSVELDGRGMAAPSSPVSQVAFEEARAELPITMDVLSWLRPVDEILPQMVYKSGHTNIIEIFRRMENALQGSTALTARYIKQVERALTIPDGKGRMSLMKRPRRQALYQYMTAKPEEVAAVADKFQITEAEKRAAELLRDLLGRTPTQGLFARFIDDPNKFLFDYLPRFLNNLERTPAKVLAAQGSDINRAAKIMAGDYLPEEVKFSANENRLADILTLAVDDDVLSVMKKYVAMGMRRVEIGPIWKEMGEAVKAAKKAGTLPRSLEATLTMYQQNILGIPSSFGRKHMTEVGKRLATKLGLENRVMTNTIHGLMSVSYMSFMGWRPWLPFRNMWQIYTTLGPRFGNKYVNQAISAITDGKVADNIMEHLQAMGIVEGRIPVWSELVDEGTALGRLVRKSLHIYKNSDDFTRIVAYLTTKNMWDDALGAVRRGEIRLDQFMERAQVNLVDRDVQHQVWNLIRRNEWDTALDVYANRVVKDTMFDYRTAMKPRAFNSGIPGYIFGQFGTYPAYYVANLLKGFRYGTRAQKIAFASRWLFNSFALWGAFQSIGVNARNFLPWAPAQFSGGPLYQMATNAIDALAPGYRGRQARGEMRELLPFNVFDAIFKGEELDWGKVPALVPGATQYRNIREAVRYAQDSDPLRTSLALLSTPIKREDPGVWDALLDLYPSKTFNSYGLTEEDALRAAFRRR